MRDSISIVSMASVSALGSSENQIWQHYLDQRSLIKEKDFSKFSALVSRIGSMEWDEINENKKIKNKKDLDHSVLIDIDCSRKDIENTGLKEIEYV